MTGHSILEEDSAPAPRYPRRHLGEGKHIRGSVGEFGPDNLQRTTQRIAFFGEAGKLMYDSDIADIWDAVYRGRGRNYLTEAEGVAELIRQRQPAAASLLDVACGTGAHLSCFTTMFENVEGVELSEGMLAAGRAEWPTLNLHQGDMRTFDLGRRFDAVTCLFSSIGHAATTDELDRTVNRFVDHLNPGGVVVIEPWWFPETFIDGYVTGDVVHDAGRVIGRVSHSTREAGASRVSVHFLVADAEKGIQYFTEELIITLFSREEYEQAISRAGCIVEFVESGPRGRGFFVGHRASPVNNPTDEQAA
ncbi:class I SAM-dependent DNA methyltransferase [Amycolatopsis marina]|uniref:class I SAM-dependent DNA methyltransferase n=1 Tax=Amycolatopsis marina TaxID=490629 RepID=UPI001FE57457|nr:class I SAM-dependent methyltransferase [Amycolatopsis marina]